MTMPLPHTRVLLIALLVLANNLAWIYLVRHMRSDTGPGSSATAGQPKPIGAYYKRDQDDDSALATLGAGRIWNTEVAQTRATRDIDGATDSSPAQSPVGTPTEGTDIPVHMSQDAILQRHLNLEYFFQGNAARKLQTIEELSPQGEAIDLLTRILQSEPDSNIRIAALHRLQHERSYAATSLAIRALDDRAAEVSATALKNLVAGGDRTLVPLLKERLASVIDQRLRTRYVQAIHELEYSASMVVDGVNN